MIFVISKCKIKGILMLNSCLVQTLDYISFKTDVQTYQTKHLVYAFTEILSLESKLWEKI